MSVCLSTVLYENIYQNYIDSDILGTWLKKLNYKFSEIIVMFNNISDEGFQKSVEYLKNFENENISYYKSDDYADEVIKLFSLKDGYKQETGYLYSISYFCQILLSKSDYLLYIAPDISIINPCFDFISDSISVVDNIDDCLTTTLCCFSPGSHIIDPNSGSFSYNFAEKEEEGVGIIYNKPTNKHDLFYLSSGFGDHVYFSSRNKLLNIDYNTHHIAGDKWEPYGGNSFEKRLNCYMNNNLLYRYITKNHFYSHLGWPYYLKDEIGN